jgi:hypothetical protein
LNDLKANDTRNTSQKDWLLPGSRTAIAAVRAGHYARRRAHPPHAEVKAVEMAPTSQGAEPVHHYDAMRKHLETKIL